LEALVINGDVVGKLHALGVLHGWGALRETVLLTALEDSSPIVRGRAIALASRIPALGEALLAKLSTLTADPDPRVRVELALGLKAWPNSASLLRLALRDHAHPWIGPAILSHDPATIAKALLHPFLEDPGLARDAAPFVARLVEICAASHPKEMIGFLVQGEPDPVWLRSFGEGLRRAKMPLRVADPDGKLNGLFRKASERAKDEMAPTEARIAALEILSLAPAEPWQAAVRACLASRKAARVQLAALKLVAAQSGDGAAGNILDHWSAYEAAEVQIAALDLLLARPERFSALLRAIESGVVPGGALSASQVQSVLRNPDAKLVARARQVLAAQIPPSRDEVIARYQEAVRSKGDPALGRVHFQQRCLTCHRAEGDGFQVGPDLITVKTKGREALLTAILNPGKEVAAQYVFYSVTTKEDETVAGLIVDDNATGMTLRMPGGFERRIERAAIQGSASAGASLMPEGLESGMSVQEMADLLSFIEELRR
jgi:putative heme-binding domain-containing protein